MRLFADHCLPIDIVGVLRALDLPVERARQVGLDRAPDEELFERAQKRRQVLVTTDHDFANVARFDIRHSRGVVIFELVDMSKATLRSRAEWFFRQTSPRALRGKLFIVGAHDVRVWPKR